MIRIRVVLVIMVMIVEVVMIMVMRNGNHEKMVGVLWMEFKDRRELYFKVTSVSVTTRWCTENNST